MGPSPAGEHDQPEYSAQQFHTFAALKMLLCICLLPLLLALLIPCTYTLEPRQYDIGNAISFVITFEIDSFVAP